MSNMIILRQIRKGEAHVASGLYGLKDVLAQTETVCNAGFYASH